MKISNLTILSLAAALLPVASIAQSIAKPSAFVGPVISGSVSASDRKFVRGAAQGGMAEQAFQDHLAVIERAFDGDDMDVHRAATAQRKRPCDQGSPLATQRRRVR